MKTIGVASVLGLPLSTTQVRSSGVVCTMAANRDPGFNGVRCAIS